MEFIFQINGGFAHEGIEFGPGFEVADAIEVEMVVAIPNHIAAPLNEQVLFRPGPLYRLVFESRWRTNWMPIHVDVFQVARRQCPKTNSHHNSGPEAHCSTKRDGNGLRPEHCINHNDKH